GLVPPMRSRLWWCVWQKRTGIGAIDGSRVRCPIWATSCSQHDCCDSGTARDRAGAGAEPEDDPEGVSEPALGDDRGHGFLHRRSMDPARFTAVPRAVLHRLVYTEGGDRRHRTGGERIVDEPDRPESHGLRRWNPDGKTVPDSRP